MVKTKTTMDRSAELSQNMNSIMEYFEERMAKMEQELHAAKPAPAHKNISSLASEFSDFKAHIWKVLGMLKVHMELLTSGLDRHETASRRKVLLVHGVPEATDEKPDAVLKDVLADRLKVSVECIGAISVTHRLGAKGAKGRPLLVRFSSVAARSEVWQQKKALKGTGITITEFLTKARHELFTAARKHFGMSNAWSSEGKIIVLLPDKSRQKVECWRDLQPLTSKYPCKVSPSSSPDKEKKAAEVATGGSVGGVATRKGAQKK